MVRCEICKCEAKERDEWLVEVYKPILSIKNPFNERRFVHLKCIKK